MRIHFPLAQTATIASFLALGIHVTPNAVAQNNYTEAGQSITNSFTLDYSVNAVPQTQLSGSADAFTVDRLVDLLVSYQTNSDDDALQPGTVATTMLFKLDNEGNDTFAYELAFANQTGETPAEFDLGGTITIQYSVNTDGDNAFEPGTDDGPLTSYATRTPDLAKDESLWIVITGDIPASAVDTAKADIALTATAVQPSAWAIEAGATLGAALVADSDGNNASAGSSAENVFADGAGSGGDSANDAIHSDVGTFTISSANLNAVKSVTVMATNLDGSYACTDFGAAAVTANEYSTPGACLEYLISVSNSGSASAGITSIADELPLGVIYKASQAANFTTAGTLSAPVADTVCNGIDNCRIAYDGSTLDNGQTGTVRIRVIVN